MRTPDEDRAPAALRALLRLYPRAFRARHGREWLRFVRYQRREARYRGALGAARYWVEVTTDALVSGLAARRMNREGGDAMMGGMLGELRTTVRSLGRNPVFTVLVVTTLALGIGATTSIFGLANWLVLRPVPGVGGSEELVTIRFRTIEGHEGQGWFLASHPDYEALVSGVPALSSTAGVYETDAHVVLPGEAVPRRISSQLVTSGYAATLGLDPTLGRVPSPTSVETREVMLSHRLWSERFGADPAVLGRSLTVNGDPFVIVGVGPEGFRGPNFPIRSADLWFPVTAHEDLAPNYPADLLSDRSTSFYITVFGRLAEGAGPDEAEAQLTARRNAIVETFGDEASIGHTTPRVQPGLAIFESQQARLDETLAILLGVAALLLLLATANAGNLALGRGIRRERELAVRTALGAGRSRIARMLVSEGLVLGAAGGLLGLLSARGVVTLFAGEQLIWPMPGIEPVALDGRVLGFAAALSLAVGILFSLLPAWILGRGEGIPGLRGGRGNRGRSRLRSGLVSAQIGLSLALVVGSGLLLSTVRNLERVELGLDPRGVLEGTVDPGTQGYPADELRAFWRRLLDDTRSSPGIAAAGLAWAPIHGSVGSGTAVLPEGAGEREPVRVLNNYVSDGFLEAVGLTLLEGRDFEPREMRVDPPADVVILSRTLAEELFPGGRALGRHVVSPWREGRRFEVIGIVADARLRNPKDDDLRLVLEPFGQAWMPSWATLYARSASGAPPAPSQMTGVLRRIDPGLPLYDVQPLTERLAGGRAEERVLATATGVFAALALLLAGVGLYGVMAQTVNARRHELAVRVALGASGSRVRSRVFGQGVRITALGLLLGGALTWATIELVTSRLWGVSPMDLRVLGAAVATLAGAMALACWLPARRATRADPVAALRAE